MCCCQENCINESLHEVKDTGKSLSIALFSDYSNYNGAE